jgi:valyl-tRNA synthetase
MIMTSLEFTGAIPFREVLIHPTVLDIEGRRMSKSLGTGVDPLELIASYGSDATRFSLLYQCAADQDIRFGEERTEMARNFCNKIWNASRFVLMNLGEDFAPVPEISAVVKKEGSPAERWILSRYGAMLTAVEEALQHYEMAETARALYTFFWSEFCDWFVEASKPSLQQGGAPAERARQTLWFILEGTLRALHPFMPFISEEIREQLPGADGALIVAEWPRAEASWRDEAAEREFDALMQVVAAARKLRADQQVAPGQRVGVRVASRSQEVERMVEQCEQVLLLLARASDVVALRETENAPAVAELVEVFGTPAIVWIERQVSRDEIVAQSKRVERELERLRQEEARLATKLGSAEFQQRAPEEVRRQAAERRQAALERIAALAAQLEDLGRSLRS